MTFDIDFLLTKNEFDKIENDLIGYMKKHLNSSKNPEQINFPVIIGSIAPSSIRSLDETDAWTEENYRLFFDRAKYDDDKKRNSVYDVFKLD